MKWKILWATALMMFATLGAVIYSYLHRDQVFLDRAFIQLLCGSGSESVDVIKLTSGDSVSVILEHGCCSGAGFDAVAIRTSDGKEFFSRENYCGLMGFRSELPNTAIKDLTDFKAFLVTKGYQTR